MLLLSIDTCGPISSISLSEDAVLLGETTLDGRNCSATLIPAIDSLLATHHHSIRNIHGIVVTSGPGSFTGIRIGLSTAKAIAVANNIPLVALSRLRVLAHKAGTQSAALDAHRSELFLLFHDKESLTTPASLAGIFTNIPDLLAICEESTANLLTGISDTLRYILVPAPLASDAIALAIPRFASADYTDPILLDGHYLRRSDAEILKENRSN